MAPFWAAAKHGVLMIQRCARCGLHRFPAAEFCSGCLSSELVWVEASGNAELFSFVVVHHALDPYFVARAPYLVADVKLAEGPHMISQLVDCAPHEARIGDSLRVRFEEANELVFLPVFRRG